MVIVKRVGERGGGGGVVEGCGIHGGRRWRVKGGGEEVWKWNIDKFKNFESEIMCEIWRSRVATVLRASDDLLFHSGP